MRLVPTVSLVGNRYIHLAGNSCSRGGICGSGPTRMTGSFRGLKFGQLRMISLSKTGSGRVMGSTMLGTVAARAGLAMSFKNNVGARRSVRGTFTTKTDVMAMNDVTIAGPSLFVR